MLIERGVVRVGLEIEVVGWEGRTYQEVCGELVEAGYMYPPVEQWSKHHTYHCNCEDGGCYTVRKGDVIMPPLVSMTYDASLPKTGAEFIVSPVLLAEELGMAELEEIWNIIVRDAVWSRDLPDYNDNGMASPSIHLHVSSTSLGSGLLGPSRKNSMPSYKQDIFHALSLFAPELFLLADRPKTRRGLKYRLPTRDAIILDQEHHGFIHVRDARPDYRVYVEWRLFEAAYDDWHYVEVAAYLAAVITRAFNNPDILARLMATGYSNPYSVEAAMEAVRNDDPYALFKLVSADRFHALREMCLGQIDDNQYGFELLIGLFDSVAEEWSL